MPQQPAKPNAFRQHGLKIAAGILITLIFLWLSLNKIDFAKLGKTFLQLNYWWLAVSPLLVASSYYFRSLLWKQLLRNHCQPKTYNLFRIVSIGYFANNLLPLKLGEVIRAWLLGKRENLPTSLAAATVVLERGTDLMVLLLFFLGTMFFIPFAPWLRLSGAAIVAISLAFVAFIFLNYRFGGHFLDLLERPLGRLPGKSGIWLHGQIAKFLEGMKLLQSGRQVALIVLNGILTWFSWTVLVYVCFQALHLQLPLLAAFFLMVILNFGLMIPSSPGGLGVFEFMVILALSPFGIDKETALGVGFTFHMVCYVWSVVLGWIFTVQMNISMLKIAPAAEPNDAL